jgi:hypothetical protein
MFTNRDKPPVDNDSMEASIRNLKLKDLILKPI